MWNQNKNKLKNAETDWWVPEAGVGMGEMSEDSQQKESSSYKMNRSGRCNVQHGNYSL